MIGQRLRRRSLRRSLETAGATDGPARKRRPNARVLVRYVALQIPGWALMGAVVYWLHSWFDVPTQVLWVIGAAWVAKDIALFPLTWRAYFDDRNDKGIRNPVGGLGLCSRRVAPRGSVLLHGETWDAIADEDSAPIERGSTVRITRRDGLVLRVRAADD